MIRASGTKFYFQWYFWCSLWTSSVFTWPKSWIHHQILCMTSALCLSKHFEALSSNTNLILIKNQSKKKMKLIWINTWPRSKMMINMEMPLWDLVELGNRAIIYPRIALSKEKHFIAQRKQDSSTNKLNSIKCQLWCKIQIWWLIWSNKMSNKSSILWFSKP